jgi:hypothetical protein
MLQEAPLPVPVAGLAISAAENSASTTVGSDWNCKTGNGILPNNASLDCQAAGVGHVRSGLRTVSAGQCSAKASSALRASTGKACHAMPWDGDVG